MAYPIIDLRRVGVVNDVVGGQEIAVVVDPADPDRWAVFSRRLDDGVVAVEVSRQVRPHRLSIMSGEAPTR